MAPSTLTPRQSFRETVALVAEQARAKLPACNGRVAKAVALVLNGDVFWTSEGTAEVSSGSDPLTIHRVTGTHCSCDDNQYGRAPQGFCKHVLATMIQKRVLARATPVEPDPEVTLPEEMEVYPDNDPEPEAEPPCAPTCPVEPQTPQPVPLPEAPASVNVHLTIAGRQVQLTLRDADEARLLVRLQAVLAQYPLPGSQAPASLPSPPATTTPQCPTHGAAKPSTKGQGWYCPHKREDGTWCPWKSK